MDRGQARQIARQHLGEISEHTATEYRRAYDRLEGMHWRDYAKERQATKRTASVLRAAWRRSVARQLIDAITESEKAPTPDERREARSRMDGLALSLLEDVTTEAYQPPEGAPRAGAGSKRKTLRHLPPDWRAQMYAAARRLDDKLRILALACGARPEELRMGVMLESLEGSAIRVTIQGAKTGEHSGQEARVLTINNPKELVGARFKSGQKRMISSDPGQAFQKRMTRLAAKLDFKEVTPYSFRHAFAADLKKSGMATSEIAKAMGHQSEKMQRNYGHAAQSKGGQRLEVTVTATTPPRPEKTTLTDRLDQAQGIVVMQDKEIKTSTPKYPTPWD